MDLPIDQQVKDDQPSLARIPNIYRKSERNRLDLILDMDTSPRSSSVFEYQASPSPSWRTQANNRRHQDLTILQTACNRSAAGYNSKFTVKSFCELFSQKEMRQTVFRLFDSQSTGKLVQSDFIDFLKEKLGKEGKSFIELFETISYVVAGEADLDFKLFSRVFKTEKLLAKLFRLIDMEKKGEVSVERVIVFIMDLSLPSRNRRPQRIRAESIDEVFRPSTIDNHFSELGLEDFKKLIPSKDQFFAERVFRILDKDGSNGISPSELRHGLEQLCSQSVEDRVRFLFQIYDLDGDGLIQLHDVKAVLRACSKENAMIFSDEQLDQLAVALYEDAVDSADSATHNACNGLKYEHLKAQLDKHPGLVDELSFSLERFILPTAPTEKRNRTKSKFSSTYIRNNALFLSFLAAYIFVNLGLLISRALQFKEENPFYMCARMFGQALNFNCAFAMVLMLRSCITWMKQTRVALVLPLDYHVDFHKLCGVTIALFASIHTAMHLINFPLNLANKLVSPVTNQTHSATEWLFTMKPGMFGLIPGIANPTGWGLLVILIVMIPFCLPFVRRSGYFELFYWTHLLYFPFFGLLILHGAHCWYWLVGPVAIFILLEKFVRFRRRQTGEGKSYVNYAVLLPSRVTHLVCRKPAGFHFHPGDYVYVNIPGIASSEWHPFTISSAPELPDVLWLHIRCAGGWTNKVYEYFKLEQTKHTISSADIQLSSQLTVPNEYTSSQIPSNPSTASITNGHKVYILSNSTFQRNNLTTLKEITSQNQTITHAEYRYMRRPPEVINFPVPNKQSWPLEKTNDEKKTSYKIPRVTFAPETVRVKNSSHILEETQCRQRKTSDKVYATLPSVNSEANSNNATEGIKIHHPLEITIDGPYGTPSSHIFRAEHAVLIAAGIGVTPFASILQSIMHRYYTNRQTCPQCHHEFTSHMPDSIMNLKKVDFFWINRDQRSFEWFVQLLSQLEMEQAEMGGVMDRFLDLHMYITSALEKTDMKAIGLQMALDLLHAKEKRDLVTGLKTRTNAGRPNWNKVFQKLVDEDKGEVTVFYCGPPQLAKTLKKKCIQFGFQFHKEIF